MKISKKLIPEILKLLPVSQIELTKLLGVRDQRIAESIKELLDTDQITRTRQGRSYLIKLKPKLFPFPSSPCWGCNCDTEKIKTCTKITTWAMSPT